MLFGDKPKFFCPLSHVHLKMGRYHFWSVRQQRRSDWQTASTPQTQQDCSSDWIWNDLTLIVWFICAFHHMTCCFCADCDWRLSTNHDNIYSLYLHIIKKKSWQQLNLPKPSENVLFKKSLSSVTELCPVLTSTSFHFPRRCSCFQNVQQKRVIEK